MNHQTSQTSSESNKQIEQIEKMKKDISEFKNDHYNFYHCCNLLLSLKNSEMFPAFSENIANEEFLKLLKDASKSLLIDKFNSSIFSDNLNNSKSYNPLENPILKEIFTKYMVEINQLRNSMNNNSNNSDEKNKQFQKLYNDINIFTLNSNYSIQTIFEILIATVFLQRNEIDELKTNLNEKEKELKKEKDKNELEQFSFEKTMKEKQLREEIKKELQEEMEKEIKIQVNGYIDQYKSSFDEKKTDLACQINQLYFQYVSLEENVNQIMETIENEINSNRKLQRIISQTQQSETYYQLREEIVDLHDNKFLENEEEIDNYFNNKMMEKYTIETICQTNKLEDIEMFLKELEYAIGRLDEMKMEYENYWECIKDKNQWELIPYPFVDFIDYLEDSADYKEYLFFKGLKEEMEENKKNKFDILLKEKSEKFYKNISQNNDEKNEVNKSSEESLDIKYNENGEIISSEYEEDSEYKLSSSDYSSDDEFDLSKQNTHKQLNKSKTSNLPKINNESTEIIESEENDDYEESDDYDDSFDYLTDDSEDFVTDENKISSRNPSHLSIRLSNNLSKRSSVASFKDQELNQSKLSSKQSDIDLNEPQFSVSVYDTIRNLVKRKDKLLDDIQADYRFLKDDCKEEYKDKKLEEIKKSKKEYKFEQKRAMIHVKGNELTKLMVLRAQEVNQITVDIIEEMKNEMNETFEKYHKETLNDISFDCIKEYKENEKKLYDKQIQEMERIIKEKKFNITFLKDLGVNPQNALIDSINCDKLMIYQKGYSQILQYQIKDLIGVHTEIIPKASMKKVNEKMLNEIIECDKQMIVDYELFEKRMEFCWYVFFIEFIDKFNNDELKKWNVKQIENLLNEKLTKNIISNNLKNGNEMKNATNESIENEKRIPRAQRISTQEKIMKKESKQSNSMKEYIEFENQMRERRESLNERISEKKKSLQMNVNEINDNNVTSANINEDDDESEENEYINETIETKENEEDQYDIKEKQTFVHFIINDEDYYIKRTSESEKIINMIKELYQNALDSSDLVRQYLDIWGAMESNQFQLYQENYENVDIEYY